MLIKVTFIQKSHKKFNKNITKKNILVENQKDKVDLKGKTDHIATKNSSFEIPTKDTSWKKLLTSKFLLVLRRKCLVVMNLALAYLYQIKIISIRNQNTRVLFIFSIISLTMLQPISLQYSK